MDCKKFFKNQNIKVTKGRVALINILGNSDKGISAEELYEICKERNVNINLSTIYRTLELFQEKGIVKKVRLSDGPYVFSAKKDCHNHTVRCRICDKSVKVPCHMEQIEDLIKAEAGFDLIEHELEIKGVCNQCKK